MLIDSCITQLKAQGPSRTCNESEEEEEEEEGRGPCRVEGGSGAGEFVKRRRIVGDGFCKATQNSGGGGWGREDRCGSRAAAARWVLMRFNVEMKATGQRTTNQCAPASTAPTTCGERESVCV